MKFVLELTISLVCAAAAAVVSLMFSPSGLSLLIYSASTSLAFSLCRRLGTWTVYRALILNAADKVGSFQKLVTDRKWKRIDDEAKRIAIQTAITSAAFTALAGGLLLMPALAINTGWAVFTAVLAGLLTAQMLRSRSDATRQAKLSDWQKSHLLFEARAKRVVTIPVNSDKLGVVSFAVDYKPNDDIPEETLPLRLRKAMSDIKFLNGGMLLLACGFELERSDKKFSVIAGTEEALASWPEQFEGFQKSQPYPKTINVACMTPE